MHRDSQISGTALCLSYCLLGNGWCCFMTCISCTYIHFDIIMSVHVSLCYWNLKEHGFEPWTQPLSEMQLTASLHYTFVVGPFPRSSLCGDALCIGLTLLTWSFSYSLYVLPNQQNMRLRISRCYNWKLHVHRALPENADDW